MFTYDEVYKAYLDCFKNKKKSKSAIEFKLDLFENLRVLTDEINSFSYTPRPSTVFIITDPKVREIFAADFRDRIIHHLIISELLPLFSEYFIPECFSCMPGRGTLYAIQKMSEYMEMVPSEDWFVMKMDVRSFFMGILKSLLAARLDQFIQERYKDRRKIDTLRYLVRETVLLDPTKDCIWVGDQELREKLPAHKSLFNLPPDKGLPIGNLSSQMFANFYMTPLDYYIKYELGFEYYGRYVDDFMMYGPKEKLLDSVPLITNFAKQELDLDISRDKFYFQPYHRGVKFLGSVIKPGRIYCGNRLRGELEKVIHQSVPGVDCKGFINSVNSYLGLMKHYSSYNIREKTLTEIPKDWENYIGIGENYSKITLKPYC